MPPFVLAHKPRHRGNVHHELNIDIVLSRVLKLALRLNYALWDSGACHPGSRTRPQPCRVCRRRAGRGVRGHMGGAVPKQVTHKLDNKTKMIFFRECLRASDRC